MITVSVYLDSAISGKRTEIARMYICNEGGTVNSGDYGAYVLRGRGDFDGRKVQRRAKVTGHPRLKEHVWNLVTKALVAAGYKVS